MDGPAAFDAAVAELTRSGRAVCVKPPVGVFGAGFWRLDARASRFEQLMSPDTRRLQSATMRQALAAQPGARLLVMEHLPGPEWSVDAVCATGRVTAAVGRCKQGSRQRLELRGPALELAARVAAAFVLHGLVNIQLKAAWPDGGDLRVLEVNPRASGGCGYTALTGLNLPWRWIAGELDLPVGCETPRSLTVTIAPQAFAIDAVTSASLRRIEAAHG